MSKKLGELVMYKLGTQLILTDLWAAAAANKLGFEWAQWNHIYQEWESSEVATLGVCVRREDDIFKADENSDYPPIFEEAKKWRITVTESGPNAAERFLPQGGDTIADYDWRYLVDDILAEGSVGFISVSDAREKFSEYDEETHGRGAVRIIERKNTPFPPFSEVIEP